MANPQLNALRFLKNLGFGREDQYFWKKIGKALLCTYTLFGVAWWWNETSPLGWMALKPKPKEEKEMAYLYKRQKFPYPGDKEATDEFIASGGTIGTTIGPKGLVEDPDNFQKKLQSKNLEQESVKLWLRMRNEVISELQDKGYNME
ncbi:homeobox prospero protein [Thalictrum thalictroides]|uniref:Homeobox prospero protein n=1 Tax=Thalictrum thalictroides TaxID=46969 RepID=A0A7J6W9P2_THATH|nr:homeobox prospero protein [Thalictrum thalictroides]